MGRLSGSLRCHCGNDNQNVTNTIAFTLGKQQLRTCIILFFYMSLPSLHDYDLNGLISRYIENVNIRRRISLSLLNLNIFLDNSTPGKFAYIRQSERVGIIMDDKKTQSFYYPWDNRAQPFKWRFRRLRCRGRDLKIQGRRRQRKRRWKSEFAFFRCRWTLLKLNS